MTEGRLLVLDPAVALAAQARPAHRLYSPHVRRYDIRILL